MEKAKETGTDQELMRSMKVSKAVAAMAIPSVISSLVTVVYNMADTFFISTLSPYIIDNSRPIQSRVPVSCKAFFSFSAMQSGFIKASFISPETI